MDRQNAAPVSVGRTPGPGGGVRAQAWAPPCCPQSLPLRPGGRTCPRLPTQPAPLTDGRTDEPGALRAASTRVSCSEQDRASFHTFPGRLIYFPWNYLLISFARFSRVPLGLLTSASSVGDASPQFVWPAPPDGHSFPRLRRRLSATPANYFFMKHVSESLRSRKNCMFVEVILVITEQESRA